MKDNIGKTMLLVEGREDEHLIKAIFGQYGLTHIDEIKVCGSYSQLLDWITVKMSDIRSLGIVIDADSSLDNRWISISDRLKRKGYENVPTSPSPEGTIVDSPANAPLLPKVGIWLMPDNKTPGTLENFVTYLVPEGDKLWELAKQDVDKIPSELVRFKQQYKPKAEIHTYLAWQEDPGKSFGQSITSNVLNHDTPICLKFVAWLRRTFE